MHRRAFLAAVGASVLGAGCLAGPPLDADDTSETGGGTPTSDRATPTADEDDTGTATAPTQGKQSASTPASESTGMGLARHGIPPDICEESIRPHSGIYAILDPAFASDWSDHDIGPAYRHDRETGDLAPEQTVIGLTSETGARAYPVTVLNTHEIVNDAFGGPVMVTFCPLCSSGMVASRRVGGEARQFAVSGLLWTPERVYARASVDENRTFGTSFSGGERTEVRYNGNLVMYDAGTHTYWSQILARGICGPLAGTALAIRPSTVATWQEWQNRHPDTEVLLPPPHSTTIDPGVILGEGE